MKKKPDAILYFVVWSCFVSDMSVGLMYSRAVAS